MMLTIKSLDTDCQVTGLYPTTFVGSKNSTKKVPSSKFSKSPYFVKHLQIDGPTRHLENVVVTKLLELLHLLF